MSSSLVGPRDALHLGAHRREVLLDTGKDAGLAALPFFALGLSLGLLGLGSLLGLLTLGGLLWALGLLGISLGRGGSSRIALLGLHVRHDRQPLRQNLLLHGKTVSPENGAYGLVTGTPGRTRTLNTRFWRPMLYQLNYWRMLRRLAGLLVNRMTTAPGAILLDLHAVRHGGLVLGRRVVATLALGACKGD